jgi:hypothetical protein
MKNLTARHVQGSDSEARALEEGWYAMSPAGVVSSGPFPTDTACKAHIAQERRDINTFHEGAANPN